jgi:phosphoribosylglycinamide formyltransferase-1
VEIARKFKLAIFASGNGTNAEVIMKHFQNDPLIGVILVLSNNPNAFVLERARKFNVRTYVFNKSQFLDGREIEGWLTTADVTHVILAGFLWLVPHYLLQRYPGRIINIHPALLPKFGGKGMYGSKVHEAVKSSGEKQTGITIHLVNEHFDDGKILFQAACHINASDTPEEIAIKVHELEHLHYAKVIEEYLHASS